jgi:hypothetical protein
MTDIPCAAPSSAGVWACQIWALHRALLGRAGRVFLCGIRLEIKRGDPLKKIRPRISPRPDLYGARFTSDRAAIGFYIVARTAAVKLLAAAPQDHPRAPQCTRVPDG